MLQTFSVPRPVTSDTVAWMVHFAKTGSADERIRRSAEDAVRLVQPKNYLSEALATGKWVETNIRYTKDPKRIERLAHPTILLERRFGDCDEVSCLIAAQLLSLGHSADYVTVAFPGDADYSHVFARYLDSRTGQAVVLDPVAGAATAQMLRRVKRFRRYAI